MRKKGKILTYTESNLASIHPSDIDRRAPSSQLIAELTLFVENDDSLREPRRDLECERDGKTCDEGADERCPPVSFGGIAHERRIKLTEASRCRRSRSR